MQSDIFTPKAQRRAQKIYANSRARHTILADQDDERHTGIFILYTVEIRYELNAKSIKVNFFILNYTQVLVLLTIRINSIPVTLSDVFTVHHTIFNFVLTCGLLGIIICFCCSLCISSTSKYHPWVPIIYQPNRKTLTMRQQLEIEGSDSLRKETAAKLAAQRNSEYFDIQKLGSELSLLKFILWMESLILYRFCCKKKISSTSIFFFILST